MSVREIPQTEVQLSGLDSSGLRTPANLGENPLGLPLLLVTAFALILVWMAVVPFDRGPDEAEHYRVAHFIYANGRLPVFAPDGDMYGYVVNAEEAFISYASLPGFNYIVAALAMRITPGDDPYAHLYAARLVSAIAVVLTVFLAYCTVRLLYPERRSLAGTTALLLAFIPQVSFTGAYVNQDSYTMAACSWVIYILLSGWRNGWTLTRAAWLGVALGLVLLGRLNGYVLLPFAILVALYSLRGGAGFVLVRLSVTGALAALVSGWWFVRSYLQTGDPIGIRANLETWRTLAPLRRAPRELGVSPTEILSGDTPALVFRTFWGTFGQLEVYYLWPYYVLFGALTLGAVVGLLCAFLRWLIGTRYVTKSATAADAQGPDFRPEALALLSALAIGMIALVFWQAWATSFATQGRYIFPAIVPLALFLALGIESLPVGRVLQPLVRSGAVAFLFLLNLIGLFAYTVPTYYL
jgi:4-amino-4-deoxy-L-arabinose transferase-like glycosyltransferase